MLSDGVVDKKIGKMYLLTFHLKTAKFYSPENTDIRLIISKQFYSLAV